MKPTYLQDKVMVGADLIRQAARLLAAVREDKAAIIEVAFDADREVIEVWDMVADQEVLLGSVTYD